MPGRILSLQRQARELGRLRTGFTDGRRPVRSGTWIITSHAEHYVQAAADQWGGTPERWQPQGGGAEQWRVVTTTDTLDAILPAGDPLSQAMELWSGGGCARRCDGITETLSDRPCLCLAEHGDQWHEKPKGTVCAATTRLNVFLPDMPDVGVWRAETHSYYAAQEIAGAVDLIRTATGGGSPLPIRLRIEQRQRKAKGQTKKFPVIVVELRGVTTGQMLAGAVGAPALTGGQPPAQTAIAAGPSALPPAAPSRAAAQPAAAAEPRLDTDSVRAAIAAAQSIDDLNAISGEIRAAGLTAVMARRARELSTAGGRPAQQADPPAAAGDPAADADVVWAQIMQAVPADWTSEQVEREFAAFAGTPAEQAGAADMRRYLEHLRGTRP